MELSANHNHDGSSKGGKKIHVLDLVDYEKFLFIPAKQFEETHASVVEAQQGDFAVMSFADGVSSNAGVSFMIPATKKSIASVSLLIYNTTSSGVLRLAIGFSKARSGQAVVTDTQAEASYTTDSATSVLSKIRIPKTAWDGLLQVNPFDVIGFKLTRNGASGSDSYNAAMLVFGLLIEFA